MDNRERHVSIEGSDGTPADRGRYEPPRIRVYTEEEILAQLGPAQLYAGPVPFQF